jgi:hypothetical protein
MSWTKGFIMKLYTYTDTDRQTLDTARKTLARWEDIHTSLEPYYMPEWYNQELIMTLTKDPSQIYRHCWIDSRNRLVEVEYRNGELSSVSIDGKYNWDAAMESWHPINRIVAKFETDTIVSDIEAAYRLNLNPLPEFRRVLGDMYAVKFGIDTGDTAFPADDRRDTLVIWMDMGSGRIRWEHIPPEEPPRIKRKGVVTLPENWPWNE